MKAAAFIGLGHAAVAARWRGFSARRVSAVRVLEVEAYGGGGPLVRLSARRGQRRTLREVEASSAVAARWCGFSVRGGSRHTFIRGRVYQ